MSKKIFYLVGILLTIIVGSILYKSYCCNCSEKSIDENAAGVVVPVIEPAKVEAQVTVPPTEPVKPDWNALKDRINTDPLTFYFDSNQGGISLTPLEKEKIADIIKYLVNVPDGSVIVTGYTDNSGSRDKNLKLGQDRAGFIKSYLVKNGISESKIAATSKGPDGAIADNETPEGKAKNRRTIVLLK
jgi:OmpA-OmpF porin, OOP family